jgi:hypothetical protein
MDKQLVKSCLYNWLGYGNINSQIWFIGMEEGGAEIWRHKTVTLEESLRLRSNFLLAMDFRFVWEELYLIPLNAFKGASVWSYMAAFLLSLNKIEPSTQKIKNFIFKDKKLGSTKSNHFMCEFLPLPRQTNNSIKEYQDIWPTNQAYLQEIMPKRFELIKANIINNSNIKLLVSYDRKFTRLFNQYFSPNMIMEWKDENQKFYRIHRVNLSDERVVYLLETPFFGNGQASYEGLIEAVHRVVDLKILKWSDI